NPMSPPYPYQTPPRSAPSPAGSGSSSVSICVHLWLFLLLLLREHRLGGGEAGDGDTEGAARDVVQADLVAEDHAGRVAAVLAADADLQLRPDRPAALDRQPHQLAHPLLVDGRERVAGDDVRLLGVGVDGDERRVVVPADAQGCLGQ